VIGMGLVLHRRAAALVLAALVVIGPVTAVAAAVRPAPAGRVRAQIEGGSPGLQLVSRSPWVAADDELVLDVATAGAVDDAVLRLEIRQPVDSIDELEQSLDEDVGRTVYRSPRIPVGFVPTQPDGTRRLVVDTSADTAGRLTARLRDPGVYPVVVILESGSGEVLSTVRTPVVRLGTEDDPLVAPDIDLIVELAVPPTITPDGRREIDDAELDRLESLAALVDGAVRPGASVPVSIAVRPDTLDALTASADPRAARIVEALLTPTPGSEVLGAPYVPLDVASVVAAGLGHLVGPIVETGRAVLRDRLPVEVDTGVWDASGPFDAAGAAVLVDLGHAHVLVDPPVVEAALEEDSPAAERALVDAGPVELDDRGPLEAVVVDTATSSLLESRATARPDAGHVALAELLLRDDGAATDLVLRIDEAAPDSVLRALLPLLAEPAAPIEVGPLSVADMEHGDADEVVRVEVPAADEDDGGAVLVQLADGVTAAVDAIGTFAGLVEIESARADALRLQLATSIARGVDAERRAALIESVQRSVGSAFDALELAGQTDLNLTSRRGTLPLVIHNANAFPVEVLLRIRSDRLTFPQGDRFELVLTEDVTRFDVPVQARATGSVPTFVEILTPDEEVVLDARRLNVRSTAISGVGLALSLGALAVLVVWWVRTWRRSRTGGSPRSERPVD
jgi:hypothetical protein